MAESKPAGQLASFVKHLGNLQGGYLAIAREITPDRPPRIIAALLAAHA